MPTVHLSLPNRVYNELKEKAAELGIQVTDIIKIYINKGLEEGLVSNKKGGDDCVSREEYDALLERINELENKVKRLMIYYRTFEGRLAEFSEEIEFLYNELERRVDEVVAKIYSEELERRKP